MAQTTGQPGKELAALRHKVSTQCAACGAEITGLRTRRYCNSACGLRAARTRHYAERDRRVAAVHQLEALREEIARGLPGGMFDETGADLIREIHDERATEMTPLATAALIARRDDLAGRIARRLPDGTLSASSVDLLKEAREERFSDSEP